MKKNIGKKLKSNKGITLVALIVTIIVLLILAAVSLGAVFSQDGIFKRANQATGKYGQAKARETLELALSEAQMQKYEEGLTDEQLDNKIDAIDGELLPKEKPESPNLQNVIVDGHIFEIDRNVPKIVDYIGPADGVIITAVVSGNNGWCKEPNITVTGVIKTYSGGTITSSSATKGGTSISNFPTTGGSYTINNITSDTTIIITATDSNENTNTITIPITIRIDNTAPTVDSIDAKTEGLKIIFTATGTDNESGIKYFSYTITSTEDTSLKGIQADKRTGTFLSGKTVEIETTPTGNIEETKYTITVTATDNCDNVTPSSGAKTVEVTTIDGITVAQAKELVNADTLQQYIGKRVTDYNPSAGGKWRIFYYDAEDDGRGNGYFGPTGTLYLKRDDDNLTTMSDGSYINYSATTEGIAMMKRMNPKWRDYPSANANTIDLRNEKVVSYLYDTKNWTDYKTSNSSYAIGSPSVEMYIKAYNVWKQNNQNGTALVCKVESANGYLYSTDIRIDAGPGNVFVRPENGNYYWLASPYDYNGTSICIVSGNLQSMGFNFDEANRICPVVPLDI